MAKVATIGVVVLSEGASRRLGQPKQLLIFRDKPLLQHAIDLIDEFAPDAFVIVLGAHKKKIKQKIDFKEAEVIVNQSWKSGVASSISCGLRTLQKKFPEVDQVLFVLSDQPYLSIDLLRKMQKAASKLDTSITASRYDGVVGVPAMFDKSLFSKLGALEEDQGAKKIILANLDQTHFIEFERGEIDIDTQEQYQQLINDDLR